MNTTMLDVDAKTAIVELLNDKINDIRNKDKESLLLKYADDVTTFDLVQPLQNSSINLLEQRLTEWFNSYKSDINQEMKELEIYAGEDVAFSFYLLRTYGTSVKGEKQDMWYRVTTGFKKENDEWKIVHEHFSEPIDMKTGKAIFDLKP